MKPKYTATDTKSDWILLFKYIIASARDSRLSGLIADANELDKTIEAMYRHDPYGLGEDFLFELESDIRNERN